MFIKKIFTIFLLFVFSLSLSANEYSPAVGKNYPDKLLWGDTHLHTNESRCVVNRKSNLTPSDAFRFARGEEVTSESGVRAKLRATSRFFYGFRSCNLSWCF